MRGKQKERILFSRIACCLGDGDVPLLPVRNEELERSCSRVKLNVQAAGERV